MRKNINNTSNVQAIVGSEDGGIRLDRWIRKRFPGLSQGQLQKWLRKGQVRINGKRAEASDRVSEGQNIRLPPQLASGGYEKLSVEAGQKKPVRDDSCLLGLVLYEDDDVIALNKPSGLAVQGGTGIKENLDDSLMIFSRDGTTKPKLVHRLDRDTSGVFLVARTDFAARRLTAAFRDRATKKIYWAVTVNVPKPLKGRIDLSLVKCRDIMVPATENEVDDVKSATTLYQVMEQAARLAALVELWPLTGRTHQLRVHLAEIGAPILGDRLYGGKLPEKFPARELGKGLHLHARRLIIPHPRRGVIDVTAPLSDNMRKTFKWFGFNEKDAGAFENDEAFHERRMT